MPIPCVKANEAGLALFQTTADQRFLLGAETFLNTHMPTRFWRYQAGARSLWTEEDLLAQVVQSGKRVRGNRVFVLYGAAGSGKSEVMRWLLTRLGQTEPVRARFAVRVSRTDLDPVRIIQRALDTLAVPGLDQAVIHQWGEVRRKPVALANQMVWHALAGLFDSDEEILPLSFRLRPVVEANLREWFQHLQNVPVQGVERPLQFLAREQLQQVLGETVLDLDPTYEHLRARLQDAFEQYALAGLRVVPTLRRISQHLHQTQGIRPLLLIDDLVQSLNVFASDLLDYLLTLEEGEWDVVLGLTPAAFEWDGRGRELLTRLRELDTVDDRVIRLDLSDTTGDASSFLDEQSLDKFLVPYLTAYKQTAGFQCGSMCPHAEDCTAMQWGQVAAPVLAPFNQALLKRLWRALPLGKGRARYLLLAVREALSAMTTSGQDALPFLAKVITRDLHVASSVPQQRDLVACYHPEEIPSPPVPAALAKVWGLSGKLVELSVQPLSPGATTRTVAEETSTAESKPSQPFSTRPVATTPDPVRVALSEWLEGGAPHRELLRSFRQGLSKVIADLVDPTLLLGNGHALVRGALRWVAQQEGTNVPLHLEGETVGRGIFVPRSLGSVAFQLVEYQDARGAGRPVALERLLQEPALIDLLLQGEALRESWQADLSEALGMAPDHLAFHLYRVALCLGAPLPILRTFHAEVLPQRLLADGWPSSLVQTIRCLWDDAFRLRDHLYDGERICRYLSRWPLPTNSLAAIQAIQTATIPSAFRLGNERIDSVLETFRGVISRLDAAARESAPSWSERRSLLRAALALSDGRSRTALQRRIGKLRSSIALAAVTTLPSMPPAATSQQMAILLDGPAGSDSIALCRAEISWGALSRDPWFQAVERWWLALEQISTRIDESSPTERRPGLPSSPLVLYSRLVQHQARYRGLLQEIKTVLEDPSSLSTGLRAMLQALINPASGLNAGPTLHRVTPDLLRELRTTFPTLAAQIRLSIDARGVEDGILHCMDGQ